MNSLKWLNLITICIALRRDTLKFTGVVPAPVAKLLAIILQKFKQKVMLGLIMSLLFLRMLSELSGS